MITSAAFIDNNYSLVTDSDTKTKSHAREKVSCPDVLKSEQLQHNANGEAENNMASVKPQNRGTTAIKREEKQKSMDIESICAAAATVVETDVTTWSSLPTAAVTAVSHYNINHIPQRHFGAFPSDFSLRNLRWRMLDSVGARSLQPPHLILLEEEARLCSCDRVAEVGSLVTGGGGGLSGGDGEWHNVGDGEWRWVVVSADVARSYAGDGGGEDRPPPHYVSSGCGGCFANRGKGKRKPNLGGWAAGMLNTCDKTLNLSLKEITDTKGPVPIRFEVRDKQTLMPLGEHAAHWSSYIGEVIRGVPLYHPSWLKVPKEQNAALIADIGRQSSTTQEYPSLNDAFFVAHTVNGEFLRDEDRQEMRRLEATSTYTDDEINRLARGGKQRWHIFSVGSVLPARATTSPSTPAHESTLNSLHKNVDFMMSIFKSDSKYLDMFSQFKSGGASGSGGCGDDEESADDQDDEDEDGDVDT
nr:F-box domain, leucine-rich repeat domain, L domain-like protein [Tanacetum cinerariifolium]